MSQSSAPSIRKIQEDFKIGDEIMQSAYRLLNNSACMLLSQKGNNYRIEVEGAFKDFIVDLKLVKDKFSYKCTCKSTLSICAHAAAAMFFLTGHLEKVNLENLLL